jgi:glycosyltransferase 2 family protein
VVRELLAKARLPLQVVFVLLLIAFVARSVYLRWDELRALEVTLHPTWVLAGTLLTAFFTFGISMNWQWLVRRLSPDASRLPTLKLHRAFLTSFLTRYLPAGAFVNIGGKVELLKRQGPSRAVGLESILYELVFLMGGGLFLAWIAFAVEPAPELLGEWRGLYPVLMAIVAAAWTLCFLIPDRLLLLGRSWVKREAVAFDSTRLTWAERGLAFLIYVGVNLIQGIAVLCLLFAVYPGMPPDPGVMLHVIAAYPIGRLVGQATPFAPGGIGVREAAFAFLVLPWLPPEPVVISATLMRLLSVLIEIAAALLVIGLDRRAPSAPPQAGGPRATGEDPG